MQRAAVLDMDLAPDLSRTPAARSESGRRSADDSFSSSWNDKHSSALTLVGRIVVCVWRLIRAELATVTSFTFENVAHVVIKERHPHFSHRSLSKWWATTAERYAVPNFTIRWSSLPDANVQIISSHGIEPVIFVIKGSLQP